MERHVGVPGGGKVVATVRRLGGGHRLEHLGDLVVAGARDGEPNRRLLDRAADDVDLDQVTLGEAAHERPAPRQVHGDAGSRQLLERIADRAAGDAEPLRELRLHEPSPGGQAAFEDLVAEPFRNRLPELLVRQHGDGLSPAEQRCYRGRGLGEGSPLTWRLSTVNFRVGRPTHDPRPTPDFGLAHAIGAPMAGTGQEQRSMASFPSHAKVVVIGAGIVGNSVAYHLANLGWRDILLIDKGPLPNPGGSTGHASNFIFLVDHNKEMTALTVESARQYADWGVYTTCGGIEVARSETRMNELRRRMDSAKNWAIDDARLVTPAEIKDLVPFIDESILVGGFYTPGVGVVDSLRFGTLCREKAEAMGALTVFANTEVLGFGVEHERIQSVETTRGIRRGGVRRDRWRRLGPEDRRDGGCANPAHADRPPDGRLRPGAAVRAVLQGDRVPDRPGHGRPDVRAPGRPRPRGRLVRPPLDPP